MATRRDTLGGLFAAGAMSGASVAGYAAAAAGHAPFIEDPSRFNRELAAFVSNARPA